MAFVTRRCMLSSTAMTLVLAGLPARAQTASNAADTEWRNYANDLAGTRYAPLDQIHAGNFDKLEVAWRFPSSMLGSRPEYTWEATPLVIKGRLYTTAGSRRDVVCLDARTGELLWMFRKDEGERARNAPRQYSGRGLAYWTDGSEERILYVTTGYQLVALDAKTGVAVAGFGENGVVDLKLNDDQVIDPNGGEIGLHATPSVARNVVIVGAAHASGSVPGNKPRSKGYVRGFDVKTGKRLWIFHTIPMKGEFGYDSWIRPGEAEKATNTGDWAQISVDEELGLAYLGIEIPSADESGVRRQGNGLFSNCLVAVELETGKRRWHYQLIHHDIWDRDVPCAAILCDIPHNGKMVKALAQPSKQCFLYVLNRETGQPIWPFVEKKAPQGDVPGEWYSPTQPIPSKPPPYDVQSVNPSTVIDFTPELHAKALRLLSHYRTGPVYTPPSLSKADGTWGTLTSLATQGGTNWPGGCYDPETHTVYTFSETTVADDGLVPGNPRFSDADYVRGNFSAAPTRAAVTQGGEEYLAPPTAVANAGAGAAAPGSAEEFRPGVLTVDGLPLMKPPYGRITATDLTKGEIAWQVAHGDTPDNIRNHPALKGLNIPRTGRPGLLGPTVTKSLVICGESGFATTSSGKRGAMLRAYDKKTGEDRGAVYIPAPQTGCPMTYMLGGRQHIVLAIGGPGYPAELIAFRLPQ
ncbi:MAG TPA: PQQ-binding-like beta-propeller repeat protein [Rhizomicrobium sp.]|nr:PQQ-binding-like beta-propeller repeat protein [Rhizomicrobium sp.]